MQFTHVDLFSGIGGFALAARWAGIETVQFVEIDKFCQKVLQKNFPGVPIHDDIKTFKYTGTTPFILTGGFPCQPFSCAGKRRGKEDDRYLWPSMVKIIQETRPTWIIGENVAGIISMGIEQVVSDLESINYQCQPILIPTAAVWGWHRRDRVWFIAHLQGMDGTFSLEEKDRGELQGCDEHRRCFEPSWFDSASRLCRKDDGIPSRLDKNRLKALGNAIVPQVAYQIIKAIMEISENTGGKNKDAK